MESHRRTKGNSKRPYEKPRLRSISLVAEEVLGVGCKFVDHGTAPLATPCDYANCAQAGS